MSDSGPGERRRESGARMMIALALSLGALGYAIAVVVVASKAPDKGFVAFTGHRIVQVDPNGPADRAGLQRGDVVVAVDGHEIRSTAEYVDRMLRRSPGETVAVTVDRSGQRIDVELLLEEAPTPWIAVIATVLAAVLLVLGLIARWSRPGDVAARRFWRTTVVFAMVYAGVLSWTHLLVHPELTAVLACALFLASSLATDFALVFPMPEGKPVRVWRAVTFGVPALLLVGVAIATWAAVRDFRAGNSGDAALAWVVRCIVGLMIFVTINSVLGLVHQFRRARLARGTERSQVKWLLFGFTLSALPGVAAIPFAVRDIDMFLLVDYRPFVVLNALTWFAANSVAVLRIRLADVDSVIKRSVVYAMASTGAVAVYLGVVLGVGVVAERLLGPDTLIPQVIAAVTAAALFGPIRRRVTAWLDRRFFRDRVHYVAALRELAETTARLREPAALAREVVSGSVAALRTAGGALYLRDGDGMRLAHSDGDIDMPETLAGPEDAEVPDDGIAIPIGDEDGLLVFAARLDGDLYSSEDRDLLAALAGQLRVAIENANAYGTIAEMNLTLEAQNTEIRELRDKLEDENRYLRGRLAGDGDQRIVGDSKALRSLTKQLELLARSQANALIVGESGTGKGLVARTIHASSARAEAPFIHVDCGAIPHGVFESELFGHERGAFTGAVRKRRGHFELADGGTLFLDEIGELPMELQPKLLRALQERSFLRVGGTKPVQVDVRIIAATNRNLEDMVRSGDFREDLYYRLRVVEVEVPPLRQRKSDIGALAAHTIPRLCRRNRRPLLEISEAALARLREHGWPGNVRELENVLERAVVLCEGDVIGPDELALPDRVPSVEELVRDLDIPGDASHDQVMEAIEKKRLQIALQAAGGNQSGAARSLGMARTTFINKMRRLGLLEKN